MLDSNKIDNFIIITIKSIIDENINIIPDDKIVDDCGFQSIDFADLLNQTEINLDIELPDSAKDLTGKQYKEMTVKEYSDFVKKIYFEKHGIEN